jgi:hypothetical protein
VSNNHYLIRYGSTGLILLKHYLVEGTTVNFSEEDESPQVICSYFSLDNGATVQHISGMGPKNNEVQVPGDFVNLQEGIESGVYGRQRRVNVLKAGYTVCLLSSLRCPISTKLVDSNYILPAHTKAVVLYGECVFEDKDRSLVANRYNMILERPYDLKLTGSGKLMVINIEV